MPPKKSDLKNLYFEHEFGSRKGTTITEIIKDFGFEGVGVFWCLVEMFYEKNGVLEQNDIDMFAWQTRAEVDIFDRIITKCFRRESNGKIYAPNVIKRINERESKIKEKSEKARESANKRWNNTTNIINDISDVSNFAIEQMKKHTKADITKEEIQNLQDALNRKYGKKKNN